MRPFLIVFYFQLSILYPSLDRAPPCQRLNFRGKRLCVRAPEAGVFLITTPPPTLPSFSLSQFFFSLFDDKKKESTLNCFPKCGGAKSSKIRVSAFGAALIQNVLQKAAHDGSTTFGDRLTDSKTDDL